MLNNRNPLVSITCCITCPPYCLCPSWWLECFVIMGYHLPVIQMPCPILVSTLSSYGHLEVLETVSYLLILCVHLVEYSALESQSFRNMVETQWDCLPYCGLMFISFCTLEIQNESMPGFLMHCSALSLGNGCFHQ